MAAVSKEDETVVSTFEINNNVIKLPNMQEFKRMFRLYYYQGKIIKLKYLLSIFEIYIAYDSFDEFMKEKLEGFEIIAIVSFYHETYNGCLYGSYNKCWILIVKSELGTYYMIFEDQEDNINMSIQEHECWEGCGECGCTFPPEEREHVSQYILIQFSFHQLKTVSLNIEYKKIIYQLLASLAQDRLLVNCTSPI